MVLNTVTVSTAVTPTVIQTYFSHYLNRKPLRDKPIAHISYHEAIQLIRQFLVYASHHTVEELQAFTSQWVPVPHWVKVEHVTIPEDTINKAASILCTHLGQEGLKEIGGKSWWQWRRDGTSLQGEWVEMRRDYTARKQDGAKSNRIMLYIHGGAYFFGSVDEHRYQIQRHARKLEARVFAPRYRLAPQYPFPCGLFDCLAAYMYLLTIHSSSEIIMAGDSAGAGIIISILVMLRDQQISLPAGAILISPWVDLTHSFPSVADDNIHDYIPSHGFMHKPSASWPPSASEDVSYIARHENGEGMHEDLSHKNLSEVRRNAGDEEKQHGIGRINDEPPNDNKKISVSIDGKKVVIKDQIQMYTTNQLLSHPLVSPVLQPSLGGLPPLMIMTGGGEVLRDEQIYLAHKAANPAKYPPSAAILNRFPNGRQMVSKYKATDVQLQVWDDLCHVAPALSFTRPAKFMYRSIAQFGAWALARAQKTEIEIQDDDDMSIISSASNSDPDDVKKIPETEAAADVDVAGNGENVGQKVGKAGEPLPSFKNHMIRQRVDRKGNIYPLASANTLPALQLSASKIGVPKAGPVRRWLEAKTHWDKKYSRERQKIQRRRAHELAKGYQSFGNDENPPPSALAGRRGTSMPKEAKTKRSWGMTMWSNWGSTHDENTIQREEKADKQVQTTAVVSNDDGTGAAQAAAVRSPSRPKSRRRTVTYSGLDVNENTPAYVIAQKKEERQEQSSQGDSSQPNPPAIRTDSAPALKAKGVERPSLAGQAFPFKLAPHLRTNDDNASTITLMSQGIVTPKGDEQDKQFGEPVATTVQNVQDSTKEVGPEDRRHTVEDKDGVLHKAMPNKPQVAPETEEGSAAEVQGVENDSTKSIPAPEQRRATLEGQDGVLHQGTPRTKRPASSAESTPRAMATDTGDDGDVRPLPEEGRRMTMEDKDGVLHKGSVPHKDKPERPGIERFETASEGF